MYLRPIRVIDEKTMNIEIQINGESQQIKTAMSVADLLLQLDMLEQRLAVEINREIVPRSQHANTVINPGDQIEIVRAIGGG